MSLERFAPSGSRVDTANLTQEADPDQAVIDWLMELREQMPVRPQG